MRIIKKIYLGVFITFLLLTAVLIFLMDSPKKENTMIFNPPESGPIMMAGGGGKRIYLQYGTIFAFKNNHSMGYDVVNSVLDVSREIYRKMIFFHSPEEAEKAGYKPSRYFAKNYACLKQYKNSWECYKEGY